MTYTSRCNRCQARPPIFRTAQSFDVSASGISITNALKPIQMKRRFRMSFEIAAQSKNWSSQM